MEEALRLCSVKKKGRRSWDGGPGGCTCFNPRPGGELGRKTFSIDRKFEGGCPFYPPFKIVSGFTLPSFFPFVTDLFDFFMPLSSP